MLAGEVRFHAEPRLRGWCVWIGHADLEVPAGPLSGNVQLAVE